MSFLTTKGSVPLRELVEAAEQQEKTAVANFFQAADRSLEEPDEMLSAAEIFNQERLHLWNNPQDGSIAAEAREMFLQGLAQARNSEATTVVADRPYEIPKFLDRSDKIGTWVKQNEALLRNWSEASEKQILDAQESFLREAGFSEDVVTEEAAKDRFAIQVGVTPGEHSVLFQVDLIEKVTDPISGQRYVAVKDSPEGEIVDPANVLFSHTYVMLVVSDTQLD